MKYEDAMEITTQEEADKFFKELVKEVMSENPGVSEEEVIQIQKSNLGYFAGYYSNETRERVERLFKCAHPYFGAIAEKGPPTPEEAFEMGIKIGASLKKSGPPS